MSDEQKPLCRSCGAELSGKDVYEGMCKACREEAILGSPPEKHVEARPRPRPRKDKPVVEVPEGAIALETDVDVEADTRELAVEAEGRPEPVAAAPQPEARPLPEAASEVAAPTRSAFSLIPEVGEAQAITPAPTDHETTTKDAPPGLADSEVGFLEPRLEPQAPERPADSGVRTADNSATTPAQPPLAVEESGPAAEKAPAPEPRPEPTAGSNAQTPGLALDREDELAQLRPLLVELSAEVRSLRESLGCAQPSQPRPIAFGFKAFFGFLLAIGLTALVALGIMALLGATLWPPALEALRRLFGAITGG